MQLTQKQVEAVQREAMRLFLVNTLKAVIAEASTRGFVVTIDLVPTLPPKVGGYTMIAACRADRQNYQETK